MLTILFEDEDMIVVNKPAGLLSIPDRFGKDASVKSMLQEKFGAIFTVHRLDQQTSGLIIFAKNAEAHKVLSELFEGRTIIKKYFGLVNGRPQPEGIIEENMMEHPIRKGYMMIHAKGKESKTSYEVIKYFKQYAQILDVEEAFIKSVGELCDHYDKQKECLMEECPDGLEWIN